MSVLSSRSMRVCGVKLTHEVFAGSVRTSHPVWVCGLKYRAAEMQHVGAVVAPRVGAWSEIETASRGMSAG